MATGQDIIEDALAEIGVFAAETMIEPADMQLGLRKLNDMLAEWDLSGTDIGFTPLQSEAEEVRLQRDLVSAVKYNLAGRLAVPFRKPISVELAAEIKAASKALLRATVKVGKVKVASTLPTGSGNRDNLYDDKFFPEQDKANF